MKHSDLFDRLPPFKNYTNIINCVLILQIHYTWVVETSPKLYIYMIKK